MESPNIQIVDGLEVKLKSVSAYHNYENNTEHSDLQLWQEFQTGSERAFSTIYKVHVKTLYSYGLKLVRDKELVKDCIQDLFIELWDSKDKLGAVKSIKSYLYKSIRRKLFKQIDKKRKLSGCVQKLEAVLDTIPSAEITLIEKQRFDLERANLVAAMTKLKCKQREVIYLKYYARLSYDDISDIMSLDKKAIYNLMAHTIKSLKAQLQLIAE